MSLVMVATTAGLNWLKDRAYNPASTKTPATKIKVGSGSSAPSVDDVDLVAVLGSVDLVYEDVGDGSFKMSATFPAGVATGTIAEVGLYDDDGTLLARGLVSSYDKGLLDPYSVQLPSNVADLLA